MSDYNHVLVVFVYAYIYNIIIYYFIVLTLINKSIVVNTPIQLNTRFFYKRMYIIHIYS